jgi:hypothetical protein
MPQVWLTVHLQLGNWQLLLGISKLPTEGQVIVIRIASYGCDF